MILSKHFATICLLASAAVILQNSLGLPAASVGNLAPSTPASMVNQAIDRNYDIKYSPNQTGITYGSLTVLGSAEDIQAIRPALDMVASDIEASRFVQRPITVQCAREMWGNRNGIPAQLAGLAVRGGDKITVDVNRPTVDMAGTIYHEFLHTESMSHAETYPLQVGFVQRWGGDPRIVAQGK